MKRKRNKKENTIDKAYKGILYPNEEQKVIIAKTIGCSRFVYNRFLNERKTEYKESRKSISYEDQCKELPGMKKDPAMEVSEMRSVARQRPQCGKEHSGDRP